MNICRILISAVLLLTTCSGWSAESVVSRADRDWQAYESATTAQPPKPIKEMSRLELAQHREARLLRLRELGLAFIEKHPQDPRRWSIVHRFSIQIPKFVREWGPLNAEGIPDQPVVDEVAAAAWKLKMAELKAAMAKATDLPEEVQNFLAGAAERESNRKSFFTKWQSGKEMARDFTMHAMSGEEVKLADYRGKVVVLDFWAPWCGPCKAAMPHVQEIASRYKSQGVVVVASCTNDTRENFEKWVKENQASYPDIIWAFDPAGKGEERASKVLYDTPGIPCQFVIDRDGRVVDVVLGYLEGEVILDAALARAGIKVDAAILAQAEADQKKRQGSPNFRQRR